MHTLLVLYADKDKSYFDELQNHLSWLQREGVINLYHKYSVEVSSERETVLQSYLQQADMVLLLVSSDFIALDKEYKRAQQALQKGKTVVLILVRPCMWQNPVWEQLSTLPANGKAISEYTNQDKAFYDITIALRQIIDPTYVAPIAQQEYQQQTNKATIQTAKNIYNIGHIDKANFS